MKRIISICILLIFCTGLFAQYKKASFFGKEGRTYGLGAQLYSMGDGKGTVTGFNISFGRDQDSKRLFNFWEFRIIPSYKFSYQSKDYDDKMVTVSGTAKTQFIYALNYGYFILPNEGGRVFKPYITAGFNMVILGGFKSLNQDYYNIKKMPSERNLNLGLGGGVGSIINIGGNFSIKLEGGYNFQYNYSDITDTDYKPFFVYTSHTYASAGIRYRLVED